MGRASSSVSWSCRIGTVLARHHWARRRRVPVRQVGAGRGCKANWSPLSKGQDLGRRPLGHRVDLGSHCRLPQPRLPRHHAPSPLLLARQEERQGALCRPDTRRQEDPIYNRRAEGPPPRWDSLPHRSDLPTMLRLSAAGLHPGRRPSRPHGHAANGYRR